MPGKQIKTILFDFGETLVSFGKVNPTQLFRQGAKTSYEFLKSLGEPVGNFQCYFWRNMISVRLNYLLSYIKRKDFNAVTILKKIGEKKRIKLSQQQWEHLVWLWYEPLSKVGKAEPDITETLKNLKSMGLKLSILSNTFIPGSSLDRHLKQLGILDFFSTRIYSCDFDYRKPDRRIFNLAAEHIGEKLENILFVGDHIDIDIKAALKIGMTAVLKKAHTNNGKSVPNGAFQIKHLSELPQLVRQFNAGK